MTREIITRSDEDVVVLENYENGELKDVTSVTLSDSVAAYGIKQTVAGTVTVAAGTLATRVSVGKYSYNIDSLSKLLAYTGCFKVTRADATIEYETFSIPIAAVSTETAYCTVAEAEVYFSGRLGADAWDDAVSTDKSKALITATRMIDRLNYIGIRTSELQSLQFPRNDDTSIPTDIKNATCELALALLDGVDPDLEYENLSMVAQGYSNAKSTYDRSSKPEHILSGIPSFRAWTYLKPYLRDNLTFDLSRVS